MSGERLDLEATYRAFSDGAVFRRLVRDAVRVTGPAARDYLQGQCTQDLTQLEVGDSCFSLLLSVQGKVEALARVSMLEPDVFLLDTEAGQGETLYERLRRFKVRVKADLELLHVPGVELRGPKVRAEDLRGIAGAVVLAPFRRGPVGVDLLGVGFLVAGPDGAPGELALPDGLSEGDPAAFEVARIEAGVPRAPEELDDSVIPFEAGIVAETTSFTKGCYTGQELVARLEARGANVPRHLRGVVFPPGPAEAASFAASRLRVGEKEVGRVTSAAFSPRTGSVVALAYVQRSVVPPAPAELVPGESGTAEAVAVEVQELPLVGR